jgi:hypothetical protein
MAAIRGAGLPTTLGKLVANLESLGAGETRLLPAGYMAVNLGQYSYLQIWDPVLNYWRTCPRPWNGYIAVDCDGNNERLINLSGCPVGAIVTNAGSGYTSAPTVTISGQISTWTAIVGGLVNTVQSVVSGGSGYTIPPRLTIAAPPSGGVPATGHCTISSGAVNAIVIDNQGAGYLSAPTCYLTTDPNDLGTAIVSAGAAFSAGVGTQTLAITGAGTIAAVVNTNPGLPLTSVPTLVFAGGGGSSAAATPVMNFACTGYTVSAGGTGFNAGTLLISGGGVINPAVTVPTHTNPAIEQGIVLPRQAKLTPALSGGAIVASATTAPLNVEDWGSGFQLIPNAVPIDGHGLATGAATVAFTVGGQTDTVWVQPLIG